MKKCSILFLIVCAISFVGFSNLGAQTQKTGTKSDVTSPPPREACRAIEAYVAKIDTAKSISDLSKRGELYQNAKQELDKVLKQYKQSTLATLASDYVTYTEQVATAEATNPKLNEYLEKRSKLRASLLEMCSGYTISR